MFKFKLGYNWLLGEEGDQRIDAPFFAVLYGIHTGGSLQKACKEVGLSYRYVWGLLQRWEQLLGRPLVRMERGRGARLTSFGEKLLWAEQRVKARLGPQLDTLAGELEREFADLFDDGASPLAVHASHDMALANLRDLLAQRRTGPQLNLRFKGSLAAVTALAQGKCDLAGFHIAETQAKTSRAHLAYRRWLKPRAQRLISLVSRQQGLMVAKGNPLKLRGLSHLTRSKVKFINRQEGSGTRLEFDQLLFDAAIDQHAINGYHVEEFTHLAVAATIAGGMANVGFGIQAAAACYGLDFIPLISERYFLLAGNETLNKPMVGELLAILSGADFRAVVAKLPGYDASDAGRIVSIRDALPGIASS